MPRPSIFFPSSSGSSSGSGTAANLPLLLATTAILTAAITTTAILGGQAERRRVLRKRLRREVQREIELSAASEGLEGDEQEMLGEKEEVVGNNAEDDQIRKEREMIHRALLIQQQDDSLPTTGTHTPLSLDPLPSSSNAAGEKEWKRGEFSEGLIREQLSRNYTYLGEESMEKVRDGYVVVVGCGGVGSWAALMLLRSGVGKLLLIDFDMTTLSSLNRHAAATLSDVGTPKVEATRRFLKKIAPWAQIETKIGLWKKGEESEGWLEGADWVVDAIDNINTKTDLLLHCHQQGLKVFSSMGAGAKCDPTRVQIADISNTYEDPLARTVRRRLRLEGVNGGIPVVYSTEVPGEVKLLPLPDEEFEKGQVHELGAFDSFRVRILPVLGPLPCIFGLHIATYILLELAGKSIPHPLPVKNRFKTYERLEKALTARENRLTGTGGHIIRIGLSVDDCGFIFEDLYQSRSVIPPHALLTKANLIRWYKNEPLTLWNCVVMSDKEAERHTKEVLVGDKTPEEVWGEEAEQFVRKRAREAKTLKEWRNV